MSAHPESVAESESAVLEDIARELRNQFSIEDRTHGLSRTTYARCFVGSEAVAAMVAEGHAKDVEAALALGNLLVDAGHVRHVLGEHGFKNEYLFYRFVEDEDHGAVPRGPDGERLSWGDLLSTMPGADQPSLQPKLPELDPDLGQDWRASVGRTQRRATG
ncbi:MAG: hypothetical protein K0U93_28665 [Gammaproteobacteria bacterium]|nr:hypothetical protein [Gammaproteobacteria bacterium]